MYGRSQQQLRRYRRFPPNFTPLRRVPQSIRSGARRTASPAQRYLGSDPGHALPRCAGTPSAGVAHHLRNEDVRVEAVGEAPDMSLGGTPARLGQPSMEGAGPGDRSGPSPEASISPTT